MQKLKWTLVWVNGNAFAILGYYIQQARRQWVSKEEIKETLDEAKSKDYAKLVSVIADQFIN